MKTLERRLVQTLRYEAERLPDEEDAHTLVPTETNRSRFVRRGMAAPAAVVVVMILAAPVIWLSAQRGGVGPASDTPPTSRPAPAETSESLATSTPDTVPSSGSLFESVIDQLPDGFDPAQASPVFAMDKTLEETAISYLEMRNLVSGVGITRIEDLADYILVRWAWGRLLDESEQERGESGWLLVRPRTRGFEILAATTDGVDLSNITITDGSLRGTIESDTDQGMGVDVLNLDGTPVASAPNPEGMPNADYLWGTAGEGTPPLTLDLSVTEPVTLRVNLVGGTLLSISEVILGQTDDTTAIAARLGASALAVEKLKLITGMEADMAYSGYLIDSTTTSDGTYELGLIVYESDLPDQNPVACFTNYALAIDEGVNVAGGTHCGSDTAGTQEIASFDVSIGGSCGGVPKEEPVVEGVWTLLTVWGIPKSTDTATVELSDGSTVEFPANNGVAHQLWESSVGIENIEFDGMNDQQRDRIASYLPAPGIDC